MIALSWLLVVGQLLGAFGQFRRLPVVLAALLVGAGAVALGRRGARTEPAQRSEPPRPGTGALFLALIVVGLVAAQWSARAFVVLTRGFSEYDTLHYHLPTAARFFQSGWTSRLNFISPEFPNMFHPFNSELLHGFGMVWFGRDILSPLLNTGWMGLSLLAAWCLGRPWGLGPSTVIGAAVLLTSPLMVGQAGSALSDVAGIAGLLAAAALLVQPGRGRAATAVAGLAGGLALGSKLTFIVPVAGITIGVLLLAPKPKRIITTAAWTLPALATGAFWYARNFARAGSPIPSVRLGIGSFSLPRAHFAQLDRLGFSVAHYLGSGPVWREWYLPGLHQSFGPTWWLLLAIAGLGMVLPVLAGDTPMIRVLGGVAILSTIGYLVTPGGALGPEGQPVLFVTGLRYWTPALALGIVLLPLIPSLRPKSRQPLILLVFIAAIIGAQFAKNFPAWAGGHYGNAILVGLIVTGLTAFLFARRRGSMSIRMVAVVAVLATGVLVGAGFLEARNYLQGRFRGKDFARIANTIHDVRIGFVGNRQYPLFGSDLSNRVQFIGEQGPHGEFHSVPTCGEWQRLVRSGRYTLLVLMPEYNPGPGLQAAGTHELLWTRADPGAVEIGTIGSVVVFRFDRSVPPSGCAGAST